MPDRRVSSRLIVALGIFASMVVAFAVTRRRPVTYPADDPIVCPPVDCYLTSLMVRTR